MDYFHGSFFSPPPRSPSNQDRLSAGSSPCDETDPPPFVPSPDDHISLNQLEHTYNVFHGSRRNLVSSGKLRQHKSTSLIESEGIIGNDALDTCHGTPKWYHLGRSKIEQYPRHRRSISVPGKNGVRSPSKPHWPSPVEGSNRESETGQDDNSPEADEHSFPYGHTAHVSFARHRRVRRVKTHSGISIPSEIRLRRASERVADSSSRRLSLPALTPAPIRQDTQLDSPVSNKAAPAGAALTQAYVHVYLPSEQSRNERRSSTLGGHRRLSATLQVVRSRDSVYEVIWEDIAAITDSPSTTGSSSSSSPSLHISAYFPDSVRSQRTPIKTDLASWSWGGELASPSRAKRKQGLDLLDRSRRPSVKETIQNDTSPPTSPTLRANVKTKPLQESSNDSPQSEERVMDDDDARLRNREEISRIPRPASNLGSLGVLPKSRRAEILRKRKLSGVAPEQDHFASHRDSLILAHKRISSHTATSASRHDAKVESLRQANWPKRIHVGANTKYSIPIPNASSMGVPSWSAVEAELSNPAVGKAKECLKISSSAARRARKRRHSQPLDDFSALE